VKGFGVRSVYYMSDMQYLPCCQDHTEQLVAAQCSALLLYHFGKTVMLTVVLVLAEHGFENVFIESLARKPISDSAIIFIS
jgi:hypothetical protein